MSASSSAARSAQQLQLGKVSISDAPHHHVAPHHLAALAHELFTAEQLAYLNAYVCTRNARLHVLASPGALPALMHFLPHLAAAEERDLEEAQKPQIRVPSTAAHSQHHYHEHVDGELACLPACLLAVPVIPAAQHRAAVVQLAAS